MITVKDIKDALDFMLRDKIWKMDFEAAPPGAKQRLTVIYLESYMQLKHGYKMPKALELELIEMRKQAEEIMQDSDWKYMIQITPDASAKTAYYSKMKNAETSAKDTEEFNKWANLS